MPFHQEVPKLMVSILAYIAVFIMFVFLFFNGTENSRLIIFHGLAVMAILPILRYFLKVYYDKTLKPFNYIIIGNDDSLINDVVQAYDVSYLKKAIFKGVIDSTFKKTNYPKIGMDSDVFSIVNEMSNLDRIVYLDSNLDDYTLKKLITYTNNNNINFELVPNNISLFPRGVNVSFKGDLPTLYLKRESLFSLRNKVLKRLFDVVFSSLVILFIFPILLPVVAILIKLESKGPVFFIQQRSGYLGKPFPCFKFRTMTVNSDSDSVQATKNDSRITKIGQFLRKTSLDEFPQFINVWLGQMSIVGPRPHMLKHTEEYSESIEAFMVRHQVKPGVTGWAQVQGWRGPTDKLYKMEKRVEHDVWYIENWSLLLDIKCIVKTVTNVFKNDENAF